eukprot:GHRR01033956.1.p2 GENE.GHRR01033956.1~~GHRR01033956.1.p2  ORF type:complete len:123 (+),score=63.31 GHRR01033956.1:504-872(+)
MMLGSANSAAAAVAGSSGLTRQEKAKLLWGAKKDAAAAGVVPITGSNRWDAAELADAQKRLKFQRLMGVHTQEQPVQVASQSECQATAVMTREEQQKVLSDVERHFVAGLRRADGRTVGLGL